MACRFYHLPVLPTAGTKALEMFNFLISTHTHPNSLYKYTIQLGLVYPKKVKPSIPKPYSMLERDGAVETAQWVRAQLSIPKKLDVTSHILTAPKL